MDHLHDRLERLEQRTHTVERQLRWWRGTAVLLLVLGLVSWPLSGAKTQAQEAIGVQVLTLAQRVAALGGEAKVSEDAHRLVRAAFNGSGRGEPAHRERPGKYPDDQRAR